MAVEKGFTGKVDQNRIQIRCNINKIVYDDELEVVGTWIEVNRRIFGSKSLQVESN